METHLLFLVNGALIALLFNGFGRAFQTAIVPNKISSRIRTSVKISCIPMDGVDDDAEDLLTLELKKNNTPIVIVRHQSELHYTQGMEKRFQTQGHIDKVASQSYLKATLLNPEKADAGRYECLMFYLDGVGVLRQKAAVANLSYTGSPSNIIASLTTPSTDEEEREIAELKDQLKSLNQKLDEINAQERDRPVFSAKYAKGSHLTIGDTIVFNEVLVSEGLAGYDARTGLFTAPKDGVYNFELSAAMGKTSGFINIDVMVNNQVQAGLTAADKDFNDQSAVSFMVKLTKGSVVKAVLRARSNAAITFDFANGWTLFSGYLVK